MEQEQGPAKSQEKRSGKSLGEFYPYLKQRINWKDKSEKEGTVMKEQIRDRKVLNQRDQSLTSKGNPQQAANTY